MKIKGKFLLILISLLTIIMMSFTGCRKYEQIKFTSVAVKSVGMNGLRSVKLDISLGVDNPAGKVVVNNAVGTLKHFGKVIGSVSLAPLTLMPRTQSEYSVQANVELAEGIGIIEAMQFASPAKLNECTVDVSVSGKASGVALKREYKDIPLKKLLEI